MENKIYEIMYELELNHWWYKNLHYLIEKLCVKKQTN